MKSTPALAIAACLGMLSITAHAGDVHKYHAPSTAWIQVTGDTLDLGLLTNLYICHTNPTTLQSQLALVAWPNPSWDGTWYDPSGMALATSPGSINPLLSPEGIYQYVFTNNLAQVVTVSVNVSFSGNPSGVSRDIFVPVDGPPFRPLDSLGGFELVSPGAAWFMTTLNSTFLAFWPNQPQVLIDPSNYSNLPFPLPLPCAYLIYVAGVPPCPPVQDTLRINLIQPEDNTVTAVLCRDGGPVQLGSLVPTLGNSPSSNWQNPEGEPVSSLFDPSQAEDGDTFQFLYQVGTGDNSCYPSFDLTVTVRALDIVEQPVNQIGEVDGFVEFSVTPNNPDATYQWQGDVGSGWQDLTNFGQYSGVTTPVLTIENLAMLNNNELYRCVVSSAPCTVTTDQAVLHVNQTTGVQQAHQGVVKLYPNPVDDALLIETRHMPPGAQYTLSDVQGKVLMGGRLESTNTVLQLAALHSGLYILRIDGAESRAYKVVKR